MTPNSKGWRRGRDSNPRYPYGYAAFRVRWYQPLTHLSAPCGMGVAFSILTETAELKNRVPSYFLATSCRYDFAVLSSGRSESGSLTVTSAWK